jgi:hypothetical protein
MSAFDGIANDLDLFAPQDAGSSEDTTDSARFHAALIRVGDLVLSAGSNQPRAFVKILRQACLDEACRETVLQLSGEEAQVVVDAIQLVSPLRLPLAAVPNLYSSRHLMNFGSATNSTVVLCIFLSSCPRIVTFFPLLSSLVESTSARSGIPFMVAVLPIYSWVVSMV